MRPWLGPVIAAAVGLVGTAAGALALDRMTIGSRVTVLETQQAEVARRLGSIEGKLDRVLERRNHE